MPIKVPLNQALTPRARNLLAFLFLILLPFGFFWRETLGWRTLGDKDAVFWFFPAYKFVAEQIKSWSLPLWNPYQYSGAPMFAEWQAGALDPINWLYLIETTSRTLTLSLEISFAIALIATFSYARGIGFARRAAVVSAVVYGLSGFMVARTLYPGFLRIVALAPLVLYFAEKLHQQGRWRYVVGGALIIAWQVFAAHPQPLIYSSLLACAYALFCALFRRDGSQSQIPNLKSQISNPQFPISNLKSRLLFLTKFALMFIAGASLSAVQLLPAAEFAGQSVRREWPFELFTLHSLHPLSLLTAIFPFFHGEGQGIYRLPYWGVYWHHNEAQIYLGATALSLAMAGAIHAWRARFDIGVFWSCVAVVGAILAFGKYSGPIARALYHVPVIGNFRSPNRHWMEVALAASVLAGYAVDRLLREESRFLARCAQIVSTSLALLCAAVAAIVLWRSDLAERLIRSLPDLSRMPRGFLQTAGAEFYAPALAAVCACVAIVIFARARQRSRWCALLIAVLIVDFNLYAAFAPISNPDRLETLVGTAMPKALSEKQSERDPIRHHVMLNPAAGEFSPFWFYGHEMIAGYDPVLNERYKTFSGIDEAGRSFISTMLDAQDHTLDILNARYVFVPPTFFDPAVASASEATEQVELRNGRSAIFKADGGEADLLTVVSSLTDSVEIADGEAVAELAINCGDETQWRTTLHAGQDTSEWAYDRPDVRIAVKHSRARIAESWSGDAATGFQGHSYLARIGLSGGSGACRSARSVRVTAKTRDNAAISIKKIAFVDSSSGRSIALAPTVSAALSDATRWREVEPRSEARPYRDFRVFENLRTMPRAWLVDRVSVAYEGDQLKLIRGEFAGRQFNPRSAALVDHETAATLNRELPRLDDDLIVEPWRLRNDPIVVKADILKRDPTRMLIEAEAAKPSILVLSEIFYPGWKVKVDGVESRLLRVNYNLRGVELAAGKHRVELSYRPESLMTGAVASITTALFLALILLWESRRTKFKDADVV